MDPRQSPIIIIIIIPKISPNRISPGAVLSTLSALVPGPQIHSEVATSIPTMQIRTPQLGV